MWPARLINECKEMATELGSRKARTELREYFVGTAVSIIADEFEEVDIASRP